MIHHGGDGREEGQVVHVMTNLLNFAQVCSSSKSDEFAPRRSFQQMISNDFKPAGRLLRFANAVAEPIFSNDARSVQMT